jgi:ParB-like chromosome segregation protein Spo0J
MENFQCAHTKVVPLKDLKPNPKNPNKHPKEQIERLAKIIKHQGQRAPIVVSKLSGFITKGHGRFEALKKLGWKKAAVDFQDYKTKDDELADIVADNAIASWANIDLDLVAEFEFDEFEFDSELLALKDAVSDKSTKSVDKPKKVKEKRSIEIECPHCGEVFERGTKFDLDADEAAPRKKTPKVITKKTRK